MAVTKVYLQIHRIRKDISILGFVVLRRGSIFDIMSDQFFYVGQTVLHNSVLHTIHASHGQQRGHITHFKFYVMFEAQ